MEFFREKKENGKLILRLDPGDLLLESIEAAVNASGLKDGAVISAIGTLSDAVIHCVTTTGYPAVEAYPSWENTPMELCSISGIIANGVPHLHMVFSAPDGTHCGHLEPGCRTLYLCEIVIEPFDGLALERKRDEKNILILSERG